MSRQTLRWVCEWFRLFKRYSQRIINKIRNFYRTLIIFHDTPPRQGEGCCQICNGIDLLCGGTLIMRKLTHFCCLKSCLARLHYARKSSAFDSGCGFRGTISICTEALAAARSAAQNRQPTSQCPVHWQSQSSEALGAVWCGFGSPETRFSSSVPV